MHTRIFVTISVMNRVLIMKFGLVILSVIVLSGVMLSFPTILAMGIQYEQKKVISAMHEQFPVTVNPKNKSIVENALVNAFLDGSNSPLQASAWNVGTVFGSVFAWIAMTIADVPSISLPECAKSRWRMHLRRLSAGMPSRKKNF